jgi:putative FmdB family regulatory protein
MPLYEYVCEACETRFDKLVSYSETNGAACPSCGAEETRKLLSVIGGMTGKAEAPAPVCGQGACGACS